MRFHPALLLALCLSAAACAASPAGRADDTPRRTLAPFAGEQDFERLLAKWSAQARAQQEKAVQHQQVAGAPPSLPAPVSPSVALESVSVTGSRAEEPSITNVQTAGVDEGGIVKRHGDHLVVLRRGRLFTIRIGGDRLQPVSTVDAFGPGTDPQGAWYDEMLVAGDTVVVIGYSYARTGTELVRFDLSREGELRYRDTHHLRSNDYYSSRNYASRLVGDTLVVYTPMDLSPWRLDQRDFLPGLRRWTPQATPEAFERILPATRIYRTDAPLDPFKDSIALHTVIRCPLAARELACTATAVLGPAGRVFYVSADSVFVWTAQRDGRGQEPSAVFRIPLDGAEPTALKARGVPIDQLSFLQDDDGHLNVLLSRRGAGEAMWGDAGSRGDLALLRVALERFGDGRDAAPDDAYRPLPGQADGSVQNRFVGDWLLYGHAPHRWSGANGDAAPGTLAHALRYAAQDAVHPLRLGHGAERIEAMGRHALLVGSAGADLHFTSVRLGTTGAATGSVYVQRDAAQGESRTHGFFYRADDARSGIAGLPIVAQRRRDTMQRYLDSTASVLYLRNRDLALAPIGQLAARAEDAIDDGCKASCVDWYGDARPIFIGQRVFALLGYELVEGRMAEGRIVERRRTSFAPATGRKTP
ncbi:beta-propeller domain-containing protein [Luteimonas sp. Y-2-2-4F]|nr:beta-propeller domain-containing protein [Luteimonas sp. Y-2-2-4F]MCD9031146.1 beta-propeller domain-containing protein [Luteimonas sp. Y-2-2-4F]